MLYDIAIFTLIAFFIGYDLFFTVASFCTRKSQVITGIKSQRFAVIFVAYKEDQVILESVENFLRQDYPVDKYQVVVVSDHMQDETNRKLSMLPIHLMIPNFEQSMKHKSVTYALEQLEHFDKVIIMDADNLTDTDFLYRVNQATQNELILQTHRTRKNQDTPIAVWDGISEEINNTIYRKGHINAGLSSALIGSGMVFDFNWIKQNMQKCKTFAEDKELEIFLASENIFVSYSNDIYVYDEKTSRHEIMQRQRSRWFHAQILAFSLIVDYFSIHTLNRNYIDKMIQWIPFPKPLKFAIILLAIVFWSFVAFPVAIKWIGLLFISALTYACAIPQKMYTKQLAESFLKIPFIFLILTKSYLASLSRIKNKDSSFQSTPHTITNDNTNE